MVLQWLYILFLIVETNSLAYFEHRPIPESTIYKTLEKTVLGESEVCKVFRNYLCGLGVDESQIDISWIISMWDSWGKIPSGLLTGNLNDYGQYDECLAINEQLKNITFKGKYCGNGLTINISVPISLAVCIPDVCDLAEIKTELISTNPKNCQTSDTFANYDSDDIFVIVILSIILALMSVCTCYDMLLQYTHKKANSPLLISFSLLTNGKKLFATSTSSEQVGCLNGIRSITLMWIVGGHTFSAQPVVPKINLSYVYSFKESLKSSYMSGSLFGVDTFFFLSAFLVSYNYFKAIRSDVNKATAKNSSQVENPLSLAKLPMFYIHRILRIMPALAAFFAVNVTLMRHLNQGPISPTLGDNTICTEYWWSFFLFIQNYVNYEHICLLHTWYLSADMQMYILSPIVLIPIGNMVMKGKNKLAYILAAVVILLCILIPMIVGLLREYDQSTENEYSTHPRLSIYTIGILFGMMMNDYKDRKIKITHVLNLTLWGLSLGVMLTIILTNHDRLVHPEHVKNIMFATFARPSWAVALCWIVFACQFGYGDGANWLLSVSIFQVLTRLSFSMYLLHGMIIALYSLYARTANHFSEYEVFYLWYGNYIITILISIVWVLAFESPVVAIEKVAFGSGKKHTAAIKKATDNNAANQEA